jgi:hypothetical protein
LIKYENAKGLRQGAYGARQCGDLAIAGGLNKIALKGVAYDLRSTEEVRLKSRLGYD